jgi:hypothetical protein
VEKKLLPGFLTPHASIVSVHGRPWLPFEPPKLLNIKFEINADPDHAFHCNASPDPASQNNADPDTLRFIFCKKKLSIFTVFCSRSVLK